MMLVGAPLACTPGGKGEPGESSGSSGSSGATGEQVSTGGVFTLTSATEGEASSAGTMGTTMPDMETSTGASSTGMTATTEEGSGSTGAVDPCPGLVAELAAGLQADARCELLLRFDGEGALLGWHNACGPVPAMDMFDSKGAFEATKCCTDGGKLIGPGTSPFIYHQLPLDPSLGGVGIVSNHIGALLYDATIGVDAAGTISMPDTWQSPEALGVGAGCAAPFALMATTYDLVLDGPMDPPPLPPLVMKGLGDAIAATALPGALGQVVIDRAVVVGYQEQFETPGASYVLLFEISHK
jgi:hypothetical protein